MTFPDHLARLRAANPRLFAAKEIKMTPEVFIEQLQRAYLQGEAAGVDRTPFSELFPPLKKKGRI